MDQPKIERLLRFMKMLTGNVNDIGIETCIYRYL